MTHTESYYNNITSRRATFLTAGAGGEGEAEEGADNNRGERRSDGYWLRWLDKGTDGRGNEGKGKGEGARGVLQCSGRRGDDYVAIHGWDRRDVGKGRVEVKEDALHVPDVCISLGRGGVHSWVAMMIGRPKSQLFPLKVP